MHLPKQIPLYNTKKALTARKEATIRGERLAIKSYSPEAHKKNIITAQDDDVVMNRKARTGLLFGLAAVGFILLGIAIGPIPFIAAAVAAVIGMLKSIAALSEIKPNPKKFAGKGKACASFIINATVLLLLCCFYLVTLWYAVALAALFSDLQ